MGETIPIESLLLMLVAACMYPPALRGLLALEGRSQSVPRWDWVATVICASVSWLLAYFWAQEL